MTASQLSPPILIRPATVADITPLATLLMRSFHPPQQWLLWSYPFLKLGITEDLRLRLRYPSPTYHCLIAVTSDNQEIIGTAEITLKPWLTRPFPVAYIANVAVSPNHRRQGVGRQLLQRCEGVARQWQCGRIRLHVLDNNPIAQRLYERAGYSCQRREWSLGTWLWRSPRRLLWEKVLGA